MLSRGADGFELGVLASMKWLGTEPDFARPPARPGGGALCQALATGGVVDSGWWVWGCWQTLGRETGN